MRAVLLILLTGVSCRGPRGVRAVADPVGYPHGASGIARVAAHAERMPSSAALRQKPSPAGQSFGQAPGSPTAAPRSPGAQTLPCAGRPPKVATQACPLPPRHSVSSVQRLAQIPPRGKPGATRHSASLPQASSFDRFSI